MITRTFKDEELSLLGFGAMRLPTIEGKDDQIDEPAAQAMVDAALDAGINYYDTAWGYHGGNSETVMGRALARHPREAFYLATKFPGYDVSNFGKVAEIFEEQLRKCQVDYFDFYLAHNICEANIEQYLDDETYNTMSYLLAQRDAGRIKHLGFSVHGSYETFMRFLEAYGDDMEFCQVQVNYEDWDFQDAKSKIDELNRRDIAVWVMEPLRGGILANLPEDLSGKLSKLDAECSDVEWAFRFVNDIPGVRMVLSGMSNMEQLNDNIRIYEQDRPLSALERHTLLEIGDALAHAKGVPCTACHYCTSHCPIDLDIPYLLSLYNEHVSRPKGGFIAPMALSTMEEEKRPQACIACGACEQVCPQQIAIPDTFGVFSEMLS